jgi:hypothetical protein
MKFQGGQVITIKLLGAEPLLSGRRGFPNVEYGSHPNRPLSSTVGHLTISTQDGVHIDHQSTSASLPSSKYERRVKIGSRRSVARRLLNEFHVARVPKGYAWTRLLVRTTYAAS